MKLLLRVGSSLLVAGAISVSVCSSRAASKPSGAEIFRNNCSMCHGMDGKGFAAIHTPDFTDPKWQSAHSDKELLNAINNGVKGTAMVPFKDKLNQDQIQAVFEYIRSLGKAKK